MRAIFALLLMASAACDFHCKIRVVACDIVARCVTEDKLPDDAAGICPIMMMGVVGGSGADAPVYRAATPQDALNYMATSILSAYESETRSWLQAQAAAAAAAVAPVQ